MSDIVNVDFNRRITVEAQERVEAMCQKVKLGAELINALSGGKDLSPQARTALRIARITIELIEARQ